MAGRKLTRVISEQIANELRDEIVAGRVLPGKQLLVRDLANQFDVSHAPIRDAVRQLTHEGVLVSQANVGAKVASAPRGSVRETFIAIRQTIEKSALGLLFGRIEAAGRSAWNDILERSQRACASGDASAIAQLDFSWHRCLVELACECDLLTAWEMVAARVRLDVHNSSMQFADPMEIHRQQALIIEHCRSGDKNAAARALKDHIAWETSTS